MYTIGSDGNERHAFTLQFVGADTGTIEVVEDATEFDATFELDDDRVSFTFTRILDVLSGDWSEMSRFEGRLVETNEITGEYVREDWSCLPDRDPQCAYESEPLRFVARLVRQP